MLRGVHRSVKPGGRFVGECGGHGCVAAVCTALRAVALRHHLELALPWNFPTPDDLDAWLTAAGFEPIDVRLVPRPTPLPSGISAWLCTFAGWAFDGLTEPDRDAAFAENG